MGTPVDPGMAQGDPSNAPGPNPAWNDVLSQVPQEYHQILTDNFKKWDQDAQSRIEAVNAKVEAFKPYQAFVDNNIPPDELENGLRIAYEINANPKDVWEALGKAYNLTPQQVQQAAIDAANGGNGGIPPQNDPQQQQDPRFNRLQEGLELVSQIVLQDQQRKQIEEEDRKLANELKELEKKHGQFDEGYVLAMMHNGMDAEQAIQSFQSLRSGILEKGQQPFAPQIIGSSSGGGSGYPSQAIDPRKLDDKGTRDLVRQMLDAANRQP